MNPDCMPKRWWADDDYWEEFYKKELYSNASWDDEVRSKKRDWLEDAFKDYLDLDDMPDFNNLYLERISQDQALQYEEKPKQGWSSIEFTGGQLVQARFGHPAYSARIGQIAIVIDSDIQLSGRPTNPSAVRVMWPDGDIEDVSKDDMQDLSSANASLRGL